MATSTYVVRVWLPDRPGALGQVASRVGAVRGDVVGIDILERGAGRAVDELVVELPEGVPVPLLVSEIGEVDGVDVEEVRLATGSVHDPRVDVLETAAVLVGATSADEAVRELCRHVCRVLGTAWTAVVGPDAQLVAAAGDGPPPTAWLAAFVAGSRSAETPAVDDVACAPLPAAGLAVACGRDAPPFRARERRQLAALARIVDTRVRELRDTAKLRHPAAARSR
jgi:hypothetical protein